MKLHIPSIGVSMLIVMTGLGHLALAQDKDLKNREQIGVYDSRAIAVAFAGSAVHEKQLQQLLSEHKKAKESGDYEKVAKLEAEGKARQQKAHQQAFSTASVDDLLIHIKPALPEIQKAAGVTKIISKWNEAELRKHSQARKVDVTMKLVDAFQPSERQRRSAIDIQKHKPISIRQAERIKD